MEQRYNIYFAGQLIDGHEAQSVRQRLARLFNANEQVLDKLFSGKAQLLKKSCDKSTALKYKQAMEKAGARPIIKAADDGKSAASTPAPAPEEKSKPTLTAAERIAALAAAPDAGSPLPSQAEPSQAEPSQAEPRQAEPTSDEGVGVAPAGADVLRPEERVEQPRREIDTGAMAVDLNAARLSEESAAAPPPPDTSHLHMGEVGEDIPTLPSQLEPLDPDIEQLDLSPEGTDFSDCTPPDPEAPELDLSALNLAPEGAEVLEEQYRKRDEGAPPDTGHISLSD